jgi:hypothetical protein
MGSLRLCMAARVGRVTFLRVVGEEAPKGEWEEWRTCVRGRRVERCVDVIAVAQVRSGVAARVWVVDTAVAVALARARDMFALMFAEDVGG